MVGGRKNIESLQVDGFLARNLGASGSCDAAAAAALFIKRFLNVEKPAIELGPSALSVCEEVSSNGSQLKVVVVIAICGRSFCKS